MLLVIRDGNGILFVVLVVAAHQLIESFVGGGGGASAVHHEHTVDGRAGRLEILLRIPVEAGLYSMGANDLREGIADVWSLGGLAETVRAIDAAVVLVLSFIADPVDAVFPSALEVGKDVLGVRRTEHTFGWEPKSFTADSVWFAEAGVVDEFRIRENELVRRGGAEHVGVVGQVDVSRFDSDRIARIRNGIGGRPPDRQGVGVGFSLISVRTPEFVVVVEGVVDLARNFPAILRGDWRIAEVVPAVCRVRSLVCLRVEAVNDYAGRVKVSVQPGRLACPRRDGGIATLARGG